MSCPALVPGIPIHGVFHLNIVDFHRFDGPVSARGFRAVARFSVDTGCGLRVVDWQLVETPDGTYLAYPPAGAKREAVVRMPHEIRQQIIDRAAMELKHARNAA